MGGNGAEWQLTNGTYINAFQAALAKDAVLYYKKLYDEGYLDKTFMTNKAQDYTDRKLNKKLMIAPNGLTSVIAWISSYISNKVPNAMLVPAPLPIVNDPRIDITNVFNPISALSGHCLSISAKTKEKAGAIRLSEALVSDQTKLLSSWGREGIEYTVVNGVKKLDLAKGKEADYRRIYANMWVGASTDHVQVLLETKMGDVEEARRAAYRAAVDAGAKVAYEQAAKVPSVTYANFVDSQLPADTISRRAESYELSKTIIIKAIVGEITMAEYDAQAADFLKKYQFITDSYNTVLKDVSSKIKL
jgi:ABC-type glycerol-3-phosphate transport system substrate-binding protein